MFIAQKYRLYPTNTQKILLDKHFDACRLIYNIGLETKINAYQSARVNLSYFTLTEQLTDLKKEYLYLSDINAQSLQSSLRFMDSAFNNFFKGFTRYPIFKKKNGKQSFTCPQDVKIKDNLLSIPKFRKGIPIIIHRPVVGTIKQATVTKTTTDKYFVSLLVSVDQKVNDSIDTKPSIGVDLGIKTFATLSDGTEFKNPKFFKESLDRLKVIQKRASRKRKGSKNRAKANKKVALIQEKISNQRRDYIHKVTDAITKRYGIIAIEDLNIKGMMSNGKLSSAIQDVSWGLFKEFITYKSAQRGNKLLTIGRFEPSSKMCGCGVINKGLILADRTWSCPSCGTLNDRDLLAANNILKFALNKNTGMGHTEVLGELSTLVEA